MIYKVNVIACQTWTTVVQHYAKDFAVTEMLWPYFVPLEGFNYSRVAPLGLWLNERHCNTRLT